MSCHSRPTTCEQFSSNGKGVVFGASSAGREFEEDAVRSGAERVGAAAGAAVRCSASGAARLTALGAAQPATQPPTTAIRRTRIARSVAEPCAAEVGFSGQGSAPSHSRPPSAAWLERGRVRASGRLAGSLNRPFTPRFLASLAGRSGVICCVAVLLANRQTLRQGIEQRRDQGGLEVPAALRLEFCDRCVDRPRLLVRARGQ